MEYFVDNYFRAWIMVTKSIHSANSAADADRKWGITVKRKILLLAAALMMFMGVVSASSINGDYKGNPIVKVMSNGKQLEVDEVPGMIYDGHTVVPISTLRQLGASVTWDAYGYSVDVKLPQVSSANSVPDLKKLKNDYSDFVNYIEYTTSSIDDFSQLSFTLKFNVGADGTQDQFEKILEEVSTGTNVVQIRLVDQKLDGNIYFYKTQNVRDRLADKITSTEFMNRVEAYPKTSGQQTNNNQPVQQNQPPVQQPVQQTPTNNGSNVQNGENGSFQFIGVNDFYTEFGNYQIAGQIKNITGKTITGGITIIITLFDQNGNVVGTQTGIVQNAGYLKNGDTAPFDIMFLTVPKNYTRYEVKAKY